MPGLVRSMHEHCRMSALSQSSSAISSFDVVLCWERAPSANGWLFEVECGELRRRTYLGKIELYHQSQAQGDPISTVYPRRPPGSISAIPPP
jgi:hypothetical protein